MIAAACVGENVGPQPLEMYPSIPVSEFVKPERGSSAFNAISKAIQVKPEVVPIGTYKSERYYRVQSPGRPAHCVIIAPDSNGDDQAKCDCPAHYIPQEPRACLHIAQVLIHEAKENS